MNILITAIRNGWTVSLTNPMQPPEIYFVPDWSQVLKLVSGLQISDGPLQEQAGNVVPLVPPLKPTDLDKK